MHDQGLQPTLVNDRAPELSFIIPALNEAQHIVGTLASIAEHAAGYRHEVIVVDNGSTDETVKLAQAAGGKVLSLPHATIAAMRNHGAWQAQGQVLVFLDADTSLTVEWAQYVPVSLAGLETGQPVITGSHCSPPKECSWIERHWFSRPAGERSVSYLGSAHMLLQRELFLQLGGFDEGLETGEDYELCQRAKAAGAAIIDNPQLQVLHHDYPRTLRGFIRREAWHGRGDLRSLRSFLQSKVALAAAMFLFSHLLIVASFFLPGGIGLLGLGLAFLAFLITTSTLRKYRHASWRSRLINAGLFYAYYWGRSVSFLHLLQQRPSRVPVHYWVS